MMKKSEPTELHRLPNSPVTRFLALILRLFYRRKVRGSENIDPSKASVFVCNHGLAFGPITAVLHLPVRSRPWINACMLDRGEASSTMENTFRDKLKFLGPKAKKRLFIVASRLVCHVLNSFEPIPVFKGDPRKSVETISLSVDALKRGENLLIFPEKPVDRYDEESFKAFNTGFAALGRVYYRQTGLSLSFYPVFSDGHTHTFIIGEPVTFNPENEARSEKIRISSELQGRMTGLRDKLHEALHK